MTLDELRALPADKRAEVLARLAKADPKALAELVEVLRKLDDARERTKFYRMFPDTGPHRRELYRKHVDLVAAMGSHRFVAFIGGNGVGKSELGSYIATAHATGQYPDWWDQVCGWRSERPVRIWAAGDTKETVRDIIQRKLIGDAGAYGTGMIPSDKLGKVVLRQNGNGSIDWVSVKHVSGGWSRIGFKSYDQRRESFQGVEQDFIWLDEECPPDIYQECIQRFRGSSADGRLLLTFTPLSGITEVVSMFIPEFAQQFSAQEYANSNRTYVSCAWDEVPHLSDKEKAEKLANTLPHEREARTKGVPSLGSGKIYPVPEEDYVVEPFLVPKHWPKCFGADFGYGSVTDSGGTAAVWLAWDRDNDVVYVYSEYFRSMAEVSVNAAALKAKGAWIPGVGDYAGVGRDGLSTIELYKREGVDIEPADKSIDAGIFEVFERLSTGRLKIFRSCSRLIGEMRKYRRDEKGKIVKHDDHCADSLRYAVRSGLKRARVQAPQRTITMSEETFGL